MKDTIQKQIEEFKKEFPDSGMTGSEAWATLQRHVEAFLKTALERVWEEARKETRINELVSLKEKYKKFYHKSFHEAMMEIYYRLATYRKSLKQTT